MVKFLLFSSKYAIENLSCRYNVSKVHNLLVKDRLEDI